MKPKSASIITLLLTNVFLFSSFHSAIAEESIKFPSFNSATQEPPVKRSFVKHRLKIQMPKTDNISALKIFVPSGVKVGNDIDIHTLSNEKIEANISVNEQIVNIIFPENYQAEDIIEIDLNSVQIKNYPPQLLYRANVKLKEPNAEFSIGVASIRVNR